MKSLEVSEEKANQRVEEFKRQLKSLTIKLKEAENRAELAEKTVKKLQKEVDRLEGTFPGSDPKLSFILRSFFLLYFENFLKNSLETTKTRNLRNSSVSNNTLLRDLEEDDDDQALIAEIAFFRCLFCA